MQVNYINQLNDFLLAQKIKAETNKLQKMLDFLNFLVKWNKTYNLTAITNFDDMFVFHLLDSLVINPYLHGDNLLDIGTGAGFPAVPISILNPELAVTALDSCGKKTRFLTQAKFEFGIDNLNIENVRLEDYHTNVKFEHITARAFASIDKIINQSTHLMLNTGSWILMKGKNPISEIQKLRLQTKVFPVKVPKLDAQRHIVIVDNK